MSYRNPIVSIAMLLALTLAASTAEAFDESKYPNLKGQWTRARVPGVVGQPSYDPTKRQGLEQQAPLTSEAQAILEASLADQATGGQGNDPTYTCLSPGMPRIMHVYGRMEIVITPETTHLLIQHIHDSRRIYTDGRDWPAEIDPSFAGYSIGRWVDTDADGRYDLLEVETRGFKGPRSFDAAGIPLHEDNQTVVKERIYQDKADPNLLIDEITTIDHALTRPWSVTKRYRRIDSLRPVWEEDICAEGNQHVEIGKQPYFLSADGHLMPAKKGQAPPDLRYFKRAQP